MKFILTLSLYLLTSHLFANDVITDLIDEEREYIVNLKAQAQKKLSLDPKKFGNYNKFVNKTEDLINSIMDLTITDFDHFREKKEEYLQGLSESELSTLRSSNQLNFKISNEAFKSMIKSDKSKKQIQKISNDTDDTRRRVIALETLNFSNTQFSQNTAQIMGIVNDQIKAQLEEIEYFPELDKILSESEIKESDFNIKEYLYVYRMISTADLELMAENLRNKVVIDYNDELSSHWRFSSALKMAKATASYLVSIVKDVFNSIPKEYRESH